MPTKTIKKKTAQKAAVRKPMTNAERQQRHRNKQKIHMTLDQEERAIKKIWRELRDILDTLPDEQLYAIAPILRYMKYSKKIHDRISIEELAEEFGENLSKLNLSFYPCAVFNRNDDENAEYNVELDDDD